MTQMEEERRQAVRATDRILFSFELVGKEQFEAIQEDFLRGISYYHNTGLADMQMYVGAQQALSRLQEKDPELGLFLQHLDTKLNMVLQKISGEVSPFERMNLMEVNFSASGLAFIHKASFETEQILGLHITLLPSYYYIFCFGKVVSVRQDIDSKGNDVFIVALRFILISDDDKERLIQHNFRQQSLALRNRRLGQFP
ncbi:MAG: PilZ domain-containing protein [Proteobacteria bacterium]|nr:PilZ domain-containing protein [Pseudomonadota bacterium]MBU1686825.1 PilZ domain-containing protein [Pseudomonadota bacterium]